MQLKNIKQPMEPMKWHPSLKFDCFWFPLFAFDVKDTTHSNFGTPFTVQSTQDRLHSNIFLQTIHERDICSPSMKLLQVTNDFKPWPLSVAELLVLSSRWWSKSCSFGKITNIGYWTCGFFKDFSSIPTRLFMTISLIVASPVPRINTCPLLEAVI